MENIKRAGDVIGVPGWQLELMAGAEDAKKWAEQGEQDDPLKKFSFDKLNWAYSSLTVAKLDMESIINYTSDAMQAIKGTDESDRLAEICDAVSDLHFELVNIMQKIYKEMFK